MKTGIPKISYSLLASLKVKSQLPDALRAVTDVGVDMIHYDVSDEKPTLMLSDLNELRQYTSLPFDVHLAVADPLMAIADLRMNSNEFFCIHLERALTKAQLREMKLQLGCNFGLAINPETAINNLMEVASVLDYVLFMAAKAGVSGGEFDKKVIEKIITFKKLFPHVNVHVDGGINDVTSLLVRDVGVDVIISGSYILKGNDYSRQVASLIGKNLNLPVDTIMYCKIELPLTCPDKSIAEVAAEIDNKGIGCVCVVGKKNELIGLITDTDIRKFVIHNKNLSGVDALDIMNPKPFTVLSGTPIIKLIRKMEELGLFFTVVPVINKNEQLLGIVRLQDMLFSNVLGFRIRN